MIDRTAALPKWEALNWFFPINSLEERIIDRVDDFNYSAYNGDMLSFKQLRSRFDEFIVIADSLTSSMVSSCRRAVCKS